MEPESSLLCLQESSTDSYPKPIKSTPYPHNLFLRFIFILPAFPPLILQLNLYSLLACPVKLILIM
jgi:hypothetical protein